MRGRGRSGASAVLILTLSLHVGVSCNPPTSVPSATAGNEGTGSDDDGIPIGGEIATAYRDAEPAWRPDGQTIAYAHFAADARELPLGAQQIWLVDLRSHQTSYVCPGRCPTWGVQVTELPTPCPRDAWAASLRSSSSVVLRGGSSATPSASRRARADEAREKCVRSPKRGLIPGLDGPVLGGMLTPKTTLTA